MFAIPRRSLPTVCVLCKIWCSDGGDHRGRNRSGLHHSTLLTLYLSKVYFMMIHINTRLQIYLTLHPSHQAELAKLIQLLFNTPSLPSGRASQVDPAREQHYPAGKGGQEPYQGKPRTGCPGSGTHVPVGGRVEEVVQPDAVL